MKILFDCRYVRTDHHDGISRFSTRLVEHVAPLIHAQGDELIMLIHDQKQLQHLPDLPWEQITAPTSMKEPWVAHQINALNPDVVFSPMQTIGSRGRKYKLILTIHDLIYYTHPTPPKQFNFFIRLLWRIYHLSWWPQKRLLAGADAVVAVSQTTQKLILDNRLTSKEVFVVANAADPITPGHSIASADRRSPDVVYMGAFLPYKNVSTLIRAMNHLPDMTLHLLSKIDSKTRHALEALSTGNNLSFHNGISDEDYQDLLSQATALVTASKDEGFGIPVIEAMSIGTPAVVSDIPIFHEIGAQAALYAPAEDSEKFAQQIQNLREHSYWNEISQASIRQAATYSWDHSAKQLLTAIKKVSG